VKLLLFKGSVEMRLRHAFRFRPRIWSQGYHASLASLVYLAIHGQGMMHICTLCTCA
jgi:hypothetical protein